MQTKKDEIRKTILEAAQKEFLIHGYEGASMRTIAKKANTTLGNITIMKTKKPFWKNLCGSLSKR